MTDSRIAQSAEEREAALNRALDGGLPELPPNKVKGILGERGKIDLRKEEDFTPDLNAGISQEMDLPVVWMGIVLAYVLFFPVAYWLLWRSAHISVRAKYIASAVGAAGIVAVALAVVLR